jgi:SAM-dependent methyltransferase
MSERQPSTSLQREYDEAIRKHYDSVARAHKDSPSSTMEDATVRAKETDCIERVIRGYASQRGAGAPLAVIDVGCGNGYTLSRLSESIPGNRYAGVEQNDLLRAIATQRLTAAGVQVSPGDLRNRDSLPSEHFDVLICQRVLINLLDPADQRLALGNVVDLVKDAGVCVFIEAFQSGLDNLNAARTEFNLSPIPPAHHNLYLEDGFFDHDRLEPWQPPDGAIARNLFSTHYYITRVFHEAMLTATSTSFIRNSHFVQFWSRALPDAIGDYAPLRIGVFRKGTRPRPW